LHEAAEWATYFGVTCKSLICALSSYDVPSPQV